MPVTRFQDEFGSTYTSVGYSVTTTTAQSHQYDYNYGIDDAFLFPANFYTWNADYGIPYIDPTIGQTSLPQTNFGRSVETTQTISGVTYTQTTAVAYEYSETWNQSSAVYWYGDIYTNSTAPSNLTRSLYGSLSIYPAGYIGDGNHLHTTSSGTVGLTTYKLITDTQSLTATTFGTTASRNTTTTVTGTDTETTTTFTTATYLDTNIPWQTYSDITGIAGEYYSVGTYLYGSYFFVFENYPFQFNSGHLKPYESLIQGRETWGGGPTSYYGAVGTNYEVMIDVKGGFALITNRSGTILTSYSTSYAPDGNSYSYLLQSNTTTTDGFGILSLILSSDYTGSGTNSFYSSGGTEYPIVNINGSVTIPVTYSKKADYADLINSTSTLHIIGLSMTDHTENKTIWDDAQLVGKRNLLPYNYTGYEKQSIGFGKFQPFYGFKEHKGYARPMTFDLDSYSYYTASTTLVDGNSIYVPSYKTGVFLTTSATATGTTSGSYTTNKSTITEPVTITYAGAIRVTQFSGTYHSTSLHYHTSGYTTTYEPVAGSASYPILGSSAWPTNALPAYYEFIIPDATLTALAVFPKTSAFIAFYETTTIGITANATNPVVVEPITLILNTGSQDFYM